MGKIKILVTGANGFVGKTFIKNIDKDFYNIFALSRKRPVGLDKGIEFYEQDITQPFKLTQSFDFVFHFAAYNITHVGETDYKIYQKVNVEGTRNLLNAIKVKNFIFMSTAKVYKCAGGPLDENSPLEPKNDYEKSKLEAEKICQNSFKSGRLTIFRSVNIIGPGQAEKALLPILFRKALGQESLEIFAPRESFFQFLYVDDLIRAFELLIQGGGRDGIFNLSSKEKIQFDELSQKIVNLCRSPSKIHFTNAQARSFCEVRSDKIQKTLGWTAETPMEQILKIYYRSLCTSHEAKN